MPELPEVETTKRGIEPHVVSQKITNITIHNGSLRYPVGEEISLIENQLITHVSRRAKYLMIHSEDCYLIIHLGMSGSLRIVESSEELKKHDHIQFKLSNGKALRYHDPRRFGFVQLYNSDNLPAYLLKLAPEPLSDDFNHNYFTKITQNKKKPVKSFIMDQRFVVGVGNIYANEALFMSKIHPLTPTFNLTSKQRKLLLESIKTVLHNAIIEGGTTLKDFILPDGTHGYFVQSLNVYGRNNQMCNECGTLLEKIIVAQRSTFYCPQCQKA